MIAWAQRRLQRPGMRSLKRLAFFGRGALHVGRRYQCPCCGWRIRGFLAKGSIATPRPGGYCPRCNAKARHRRLCLFLHDHTSLLESPNRVLDVAPWWSVSRHIERAEGVRYVGLDRVAAGPHVTVVGDAVRLPFAAGEFDAAICQHVLEHVDDDRAALGELFRVLRPGGSAIVSVPLRPDQPTVEDSSVTEPGERRRLFGEPEHVRWYGKDFPDRLGAVGFEITRHDPELVSEEERAVHGLLNDETLFVCTKPGPGPASPACSA